MLRATSFAKLCRATPFRPATRSVVLPFLRNATLVSRRFESTNSSEPPSKPGRTPEQQAFKAAQERNDDLQRDWDAKIITYEELKPKALSPSPDAFLIDVREPDEVIQGMIPSAVNVPLTVLPNSLQLSPESFLATHGFQKPRKDQEVTFYCRSGMRSTTACDVAKRNGWTNILNYKGSWLEWVEKGSGKQ